MSYLLALLASFANAGSNVLQRAANRSEPSNGGLSPKRIIAVVRHPAWLGGIAAVIASFLLLALALRFGHLATVEPIIIFELPLTLLLASRVFHAPLGRHEWIAILCLTTGLAGLIGFLDPSGGDGGRVAGLTWAIASAATLVPTLFIVSVAQKGPPIRRAALLGAAAGSLFGLTAAFMKAMTIGFDHGIVGVLTTWQTYAMAVCGLAGLYGLQSALGAGRLVAAQPGITLADPLVAIVWGILVFGEHPRGGVFSLLAVLSGALMAGAALTLARSPLLSPDKASLPAHEEQREAQRRSTVERPGHHDQSVSITSPD